MGYVIGDADLPDDQFKEVIPKLNEITDAYGKHYHLLGEITEYPVSIGLSYSMPDVHQHSRKKIKHDHLKP